MIYDVYSVPFSKVSDDGHSPPKSHRCPPKDKGVAVVTRQHQLCELLCVICAFDHMQIIRFVHVLLLSF